MSGINKGRVLLGGMLSGLVLSVGEFLLSKPVLGGMWSAVFEARNLPPVCLSQVPVFILMNLVLGIALVCLYASIRPRYGAGPKTAVHAGLIVWFLVWLFGYATGLVMGLWPFRLALIATVWGLIEVPLAALAGAWVYREE